LTAALWKTMLEATSILTIESSWCLKVIGSCSARDWRADGKLGGVTAAAQKENFLADEISVDHDPACASRARHADQRDEECNPSFPNATTEDLFSKVKTNLREIVSNRVAGKDSFRFHSKMRVMRVQSVNKVSTVIFRQG
jgi:hypothetical protein